MEQAKNWEDVKPITDVNWSGCLLSSNLKRYKLGDIAEIIISSVDKKTKDGEQKVRLCNFVDVYHNWAITKSMHSSFMIASAKEKDIERLSLKKGYVALTKDSETRDDIGISTYIADNLNNVILGYHCALVKPNEDILSGKYLNAFLHSNYIKKYFELNATGSGMRYTLSIQTLYDMPILLPSLEEQEYIGNIFSTIDRKIELNRSINHNLEAMAKQLYDYWFVQFDFPDENGKPYKSNGGEMIYSDALKKYIPKGWTYSPLRVLVDLEDFKRIPLSNAQRVERKGEFPYYGATGIMDYIDDFIFDYDILLLAEDGSTSDSNGFPVVQYVWGEVWVNNHAHIILPKDRAHLIYTYFLLKSIPVKMIETGSIQKKISQENLLGYKAINVPKQLIDIYTERIKPMWEQKKLATEEIIQLTKQRDELLPLLMNGQVKVGVERSRLNYDLSHD